MILNVFKPPRTKVKHCPISKNLIFVLNSIRTSSTGCAKNSGKRTHPRFQSLVYNLRCVEIKSVNLLGEWTKSPLSSDKSPKPSHGHKSPAPQYYDSQCYITWCRDSRCYGLLNFQAKLESTRALKGTKEVSHDTTVGGRLKLARQMSCVKKTNR